MAEYRNARTPGHSNARPNKYGQNRSAARPSRPTGDRPRPNLFRATCATCGKTCEVPFRPDGTRAVYCGDCFRTDRPTPAPETRRWEREDAATRHTSQNGPANDDRKLLVDIARHLAQIHDTLHELVEVTRAAHHSTPALAEVEPSTLTSVVAQALAPKKKIVAKKKAVAKKKPAAKKATAKKKTA